MSLGIKNLLFPNTQICMGPGTGSQGAREQEAMGARRPEGHKAMEAFPAPRTQIGRFWGDVCLSVCPSVCLFVCLRSREPMDLPMDQQSERLMDRAKPSERLMDRAKPSERPNHSDQGLLGALFGTPKSQMLSGRTPKGGDQ